MGVGASISTSARPPKASPTVNPNDTNASSASARASSVSQTSIDARIIKTLQTLNVTRRQTRPNERAMNFERIAMRFGIAREAFDMIEIIYEQYADPKRGLDFAGLKAVMNALGADMNESDMREVFYEADMMRDNVLQQNEFIVSLAISYLLGLITNFERFSIVLETPLEEGSSVLSATEVSVQDQSPAHAIHSSPAAASVAKALELMVTAYLLFDEDASGTIQLNEMRKFMERTNEPSTRRMLTRTRSDAATKAIRAERIKELDFNRDGTISFQEFVLTFVKWVGLEDESTE